MDLHDIHREFEAYLDAMNLATILVPKSYRDGKIQIFSLETPHKERHPLQIERQIDLGSSMKYECIIDIPIEIGKRYLIYDHQGGVTDLQIGAVVRTVPFDDKFFYDGDLGVAYTQEQTTFKVWAPTATEAKVKLIDPKTKKPTIYR